MAEHEYERQAIANDVERRDMEETVRRLVGLLPAGEMLFIMMLCSWIVNGPDDAMEATWGWEVECSLRLRFDDVMDELRLPTGRGLPGPLPGPLRFLHGKGKGLPVGKGKGKGLPLAGNKGKGKNEGKGQGKVPAEVVIPVGVPVAWPGKGGGVWTGSRQVWGPLNRAPRGDRSRSRSR